ncbi:MAG: hypothetical protein KC431_07630 [Myxococcales bacterium]|nr:hypothetical protein [Myxococcales bacterium]
MVGPDCEWQPKLVAFLPAFALLPAVLMVSTASVHASPTEPGQLEQELSPASACSTCHEFYTPDSLAMDGGSVDPWAWQGSMMGNSARDPVFWAGVALASQDHPDETVDCVRCHAPRAFLDGQGSAVQLAELSQPQREGVECDLCHRMMDDGETPPGNARYVLADAPVGQNVPRFGPWDYGMGPEPEHPWAQDLDFVAGSQMCGTCHDVTTGRERLDDQGVGLGVPFNEQRTYSEWLGSAYAEQGGADAASCQDCHLPAIEGSILGCNMFAGMPHPGGGRRHVLVGANVGALQVLKSLYGSAGTDEVDDARFDESIAWTEEFVQSAADLEVEFPAAVDLTAGLAALPVTVSNRTGHKLPSGYSEGRVMWIEVTARYGDQLVWSSGLWDGDAQTIEADPQVRRYEAIAERWSDKQSFHLLLNDHWALDSRLPPKGLKSDPETDPVGDRYVLQGDDTWPHVDSVSYGFDPAAIMDLTPADPDDDQLEISVRLLYLINTPEYLQLLGDDNVSNDAGQLVQGAFAAVGGPAPVLLAEASAAVPLSGLIGGGDTGETDTTTGSDTSDTTETGTGNDDIGSDTTDAPAGDDASGGCGCVSDPSRGKVGLLPLLLLLGAVARRRNHE